MARSVVKKSARQSACGHLKRSGGKQRWPIARRSAFDRASASSKAPARETTVTPTNQPQRRTGEKANIEHRTSNVERRTEENANIEHPTPNVQRRTEENQREKENAFSLFLSPLMFDVRRSMFNVRCSYSFFRCEMFVFILPDVRRSM